MKLNGLKHKCDNKQEGMTSHMDYKNADRLKKLQTKY